MDMLVINILLFFFEMFGSFVDIMCRPMIHTVISRFSNLTTMYPILNGKRVLIREKSYKTDFDLIFSYDMFSFSKESMSFQRYFKPNIIDASFKFKI